MVLDDVFLDGQEVSVVVRTVASKIDKVVTEMTIELDTQPVMISSVVIDEKLRGHLWMEEGAKNGVLLSFD